MVASKLFLDSTRRVVESWLERGMMVAKWLCSSWVVVEWRLGECMVAVAWLGCRREMVVIAFTLSDDLFSLVLPRGCFVGGGHVRRR